MMDRERQERDLQEVFEATQASWRAAIENTFALQEQTLEFARGLSEAPAEVLGAQYENNRATLEALAEQSGRQREAMENLVRESLRSTGAYFRSPSPMASITPSSRRLQRHPKLTGEVGVSCP